MPTLVVRRVWIEKTQCLWHTLCHSEAVGLIEFNDDVEASVVNEHLLRRTQDELRQLLEAEAVCPVEAFYLETDDGCIHNVSSDRVQAAIQTGDYRWE
jgi:ferredoxin